MHAKELRIGNYVNVAREDQSPFRIDFFEFLNEQDCKIGKRVFIEEQEVHPLTWYFNDIKPIELTEEWLFRLGFEKEISEHYDGFLFKKGIFVLDENFIVMNIDFDVKLRTVHHLQNTYYTFSGEELTLTETPCQKKE